MQIHFKEEQYKRAGRRKSPWNLVLIPFCFGSAFLIGYSLFQIVSSFHSMIYPSLEIHELGKTNGTFLEQLPLIVMAWSLVPGSVTAGFYIGNIMVWFIKPAREIFEKESKDHQGTDFKSTMNTLGKITLWALPIGLVISFVAACFPHDHV
jgi:hypothetical protein